MGREDDELLVEVWIKGTIVQGYEPAEWRKDECGAWIAWSQYGNRDSDYGWEIDHIRPVDRGGSDDIDNLRPLQWENNASRGNGPLICRISAYSNTNVRI
jgi:hypothetical protein